MAAIDFPNLTPSSRSYSPGEIPAVDFQGQNGAVTRIKYGNRLKDSELTMTFNNLTDDDAFLLWQNFQDVNGDDLNGDWNYIKFKTSTESGMAGIQNASLAAVTGEYRVNRRYRYSEAPQFTNTFPGRTTVTIKLRGYLDGALTA